MSSSPVRLGAGPWSLAQGSGVWATGPSRVLFPTHPAHPALKPLGLRGAGREFFVGLSKWTNHRGAEIVADTFRVRSRAGRRKGVQGAEGRRREQLAAEGKVAGAPPASASLSAPLAAPGLRRLHGAGLRPLPPAQPLRHGGTPHGGGGRQRRRPKGCPGEQGPGAWPWAGGVAGAGAWPWAGEAGPGGSENEAQPLPSAGSASTVKTRGKQGLEFGRAMGEQGTESIYIYAVSQGSPGGI